MSASNKHKKMWLEQKEKNSQRHEKKLKLFLAKTTSSMSDSKWRKLFYAVSKMSQYFYGSEWKMLFTDRSIVEEYIPTSDDIDRFHMVDGRFYYVTYKYIEWLELSTTHVSTVVERLEAVAKFDIVEAEKGIRIYGYRSDESA